MSADLSKKIRHKAFLDKIVSAEEAASWIEDGMTLGMSGFTLFGEPKVFPRALAERGRTEKFKVNLFTGASLGPDADQAMAEADIINLRVPYQGNPVMRKKINAGEIKYIDQHLSHTAETLRQGNLGKVDYAIIEAAITEDGLVIPTGSVGNSPIFVEKADHVIIELNTSTPESYEGIHDIYMPKEQGDNREAIPVYDDLSKRIGTIGIKVDPAKVRGVVLSDRPDIPSPLFEPNEETQAIADNLLSFLGNEVDSGRLGPNLAPLQSGVGSVANAVLSGMAKSDRFKNLTVSSEVLQDGIFDLIDAGVVDFAVATAFSLSKKRVDQLASDLAKYKDKILFRPQEITNHPEVVRSTGVIAFNTALEVDIYGNVNSTHVSGTHVMNGIGGSADFARNARITIFVTQSTAKDGNISAIVPFVTHVDHTNHEVDVIVTEQGYADIRGLCPVDAAEKIIENCMHPKYKAQARKYLEDAKAKRGGNTPHLLDEAFSWHINLANKGTMLLD